MSNNSNRFWLSILNLIGVVGVIVVNTLAVILPLNNKTTEQLSDQYPNLFVPSGLTFSIWGMIYILLVIYAIYQISPHVRKDATRGLFIDKIGLFFFISCLANMAWIFFWQYEFVLISVIIMLIFLAILITIYLRLNIGKSDAGAAEKYMVHLPFSIYLGWISIATIANVTALLVSLNWNGFGLNPQFWTVLVIAVGILLGCFMLVQRRDIFYALVVDWALIGILLKRLSDTGSSAQSIVVAVIVGLALLSAGIITRLATRKVY